MDSERSYGIEKVVGGESKVALRAESSFCHFPVVLLVLTIVYIANSWLPSYEALPRQFN